MLIKDNVINVLRNERKVNDGIQNDIHEKNDEFMRKVYENALFVAEYLKFSKIKCNDGDHMRSIEDIHNDIYKLIKK